MILKKPLTGQGGGVHHETLLKRDKEEIKTNKQTNKHIFITSKLIDWLECDNCGAH